MKIDWVEGFRMSVKTDNGKATISANKEGLLSLARQLQALAEGVPGDHFHYDVYNKTLQQFICLLV